VKPSRAGTHGLIDSLNLRDKLRGRSGLRIIILVILVETLHDTSSAHGIKLRVILGFVLAIVKDLGELIDNEVTMAQLATIAITDQLGSL
jgi:hypothetical protein